MVLYSCLVCGRVHDTDKEEGTRCQCGLTNVTINWSTKVK
jgi:DNA-directed RNA polymerase subunit RPC12/RpoP